MIICFARKSFSKILKLYKSETLHALAWKETWEWQPIRLSTSKAKTIQPFHLCLQ
jgi:hypothetical protein